LVADLQSTACILGLSGNTIKASFYGDAPVKTSANTLIRSKEDLSILLLWFGVKPIKNAPCRHFKNP